MIERDKAVEDYEDALVALILSDLSEEDYSDDFDDMDDRDVQIPAHIEKNLQRIIQETRERSIKKLAPPRGHRKRGLLKIIQLAAVFVVAAMLLMLSACAAIPALRDAVLKYVAVVTTSYTQVWLAGERNDSPPDYNYPISEYNSDATEITLAGSRIIIPEGFSVESFSVTPLYLYCSLSASDDRYLTIKILYGGYVTNADSEEAESVDIIIQGQPAKLLEKGRTLKLTWGNTETGCVFFLQGDGVEAETLLGIANHLSAG